MSGASLAGYASKLLCSGQQQACRGNFSAGETHHLSPMFADALSRKFRGVQEAAKAAAAQQAQQQAGAQQRRQTAGAAGRPMSARSGQPLFHGGVGLVSRAAPVQHRELASVSSVQQQELASVSSGECERALPAPTAPLDSPALEQAAAAGGSDVQRMSAGGAEPPLSAGADWTLAGSEALQLAMDSQAQWEPAAGNVASERDSGAMLAEQQQQRPHQSVQPGVAAGQGVYASHAHPAVPAAVGTAALGGSSAAHVTGGAAALEDSGATHAAAGATAVGEGFGALAAAALDREAGGMGVPLTVPEPGAAELDALDALAATASGSAAESWGGQVPAGRQVACTPSAASPRDEPSSPGPDEQAPEGLR